MLAKSLLQVLESRVASVGHRRPELLAVRGRPFWELLYGGYRETRSGTGDLGPEIWDRRSVPAAQQIRRWHAGRGIQVQTCIANG